MNEPQSLSIWQQNVNRSLIAQLDMLHNIGKNYDIILIQEPHIDFKGLTRANSHYSVIYPPKHHDQHSTKPTRSITLVNRRLASQTWTPIPIQSPDITAVQIISPHGTLRIINLYNDCKNNHTITELQTYMTRSRYQNAPKLPVQYIWAGDFNRHHPLWDEERNNHLFTTQNIKAAQPLLDLIGIHEMKMALPEGIPTLQALATRNHTRVDNVFCSESLIDTVTECNTQPKERPAKTDHYPILTKIDIQPRRAHQPTRLDFRSVDWEEFEEALEEKLQKLPPPEEIETHEQFNRVLNRFESTMRDVIADKVPTSKPSPYSKRWWTNELTEERKRMKNLAKKSYQQRHNLIHPIHEEFRRARNDYSSHIQEVKASHWTSWINNIHEADMWNASRLVTGPSSDGGRARVPSLRVHDANNLTREITDNEEKCLTFKSAFFPPKPTTSTVPLHPTYPSAAWRFQPPSDEQIHRAIQRMKPNKATKTGTIPNIVFLQNRQHLVPHLGPIFRATFQLQTYPEHWAATETLVLKKPGRADYSLPNAWRPIVLSDGCARLLNACLTEDVILQCEKHQLLPRNHFGGRPGRNTTDAIHFLIKIVKDAWRKGKVVSILSLDVKGAFPSTAIDRLIHNMRRRRIPKEITDWMERRLEHRTTTLTFDDYTSPPFPLDNGLDQGDPFSQTAYIIYNADQLEIPQAANDEHGILYIDDSNLLVVANTFPEAHDKLRSIMERPNGIFDWARDHNCEFGTDKFQLLDLSRKKQQDPNNPRKRVPIPRQHLILNNITIPSKQSIKILGVHIDRELRWKEQGAVALKKGQDWITQFARLAKTTKGIATKYMRQLYLAIAVPRMLDAADVFLGSQQRPHKRNNNTNPNTPIRGARGLIRPLIQVQRRATIMITGALRTTATDILNAHADLLPLPLIIDKIRHRAAIQLGTLPETHPLSKAVTNARARFIKRHPTTLHELTWTYDIQPKKLETIGTITRNAYWKPRYKIIISKTKEEAMSLDEEDTANIKIYTDGSGIDGMIGAAAVLRRRDRRREKTLRYKLGRKTKQGVYNGEAIALPLGLELLRKENNITTVSLGIDNQSTIRATTILRPAAAQYAFDLFHKQLQAIYNAHPRMRLTIRWTTGHVGISGNEAADEQAKAAAQGDVSAPSELPKELRKGVPHSKSAIIAHHHQKLLKRADTAWKASSRAIRLREIDPLFQTRRYRKFIEVLPRKHAAILIQLRTGHIALQSYLHRCKLAPSPTCPSCQRANETVIHFLLRCPAHNHARSILDAEIGRDANNIKKLLNKKEYLPALFRFIATTERLKPTFGVIPEIEIENGDAPPPHPLN
jgi:ribonuclease HI/exonuclease III